MLIGESDPVYNVPVSEYAYFTGVSISFGMTSNPVQTGLMQII
jgi:hypothetical protein